MVEVFCNDIFLKGLVDLLMFILMEEWSWENLLWKLVFGFGKFWTFLLFPGWEFGANLEVLEVSLTLSLLISSSIIMLIFLVKPLIFLCLLCLGIGSGVLSELSEDVDEVLILDNDELLSLNLLSSETRRLDASGFSVVGLVGAESVTKNSKLTQAM